MIAFSWYHHIDRFATSIIASAMFGIQFLTGQEQTMKDIVEVGRMVFLHVSSL